MPIEFEISRKQLFLIIVIAVIIVGSIIALFLLLNRPANWIAIETWAGPGPEIPLTTPPFTINGTEWRINWEVSDYDNSSRCYVSAYSVGAIEPFWESPHEQQSGEAHFNTKGTFYLIITPQGAPQHWSVEVSQVT